MKIIAAFRARPGLLLAAAGAIALFWLLPSDWRATTRALVAWTLFVSGYLAVVAVLLGGANVEDIRKRAPVYDEGQGVILLLSVIAALASIGAIVAEMAAAKSGSRLGVLHIGLATVTVCLSWVFVHVMFALNYAHDYYSPPDGGAPSGLEIPGTREPIYADFMYFSFVIGCACATADINISSREIRRIALLHGAISFFYNTAIVALTINIAAGLLSG